MIFSELKVLELAGVLAGPAVGMFFAELGANVVKIENKNTGGDVTRRWKLPHEDPETPVSAYWCCVNWQKEIVFADLDNPSDRAAVHALVEQADVLISNFKPSSAKAWGLDPGDLCARNPRLIYAQVFPFEDPEDESPAFDAILQAEAGFMYMNGMPDGPPVKMPVALIDIIAGHQLKEAVLLALLARERSGRGAVVSVSLEACALASLANQASNWLMTGHIPRRMGAQHPNIAPYGDILTAADGTALLLAAGTEWQFQKLCRSLDLAHLIENPDFQDNMARVKNRLALMAHLNSAAGQMAGAELYERLRRDGVPVARIRDMRAVFERPAAQAMILEETLPDGTKTRRMRTNAFKLSFS